MAASAASAASAADALEAPAVCSNDEGSWLKQWPSYLVRVRVRGRVRARARAKARARARARVEVRARVGVALVRDAARGGARLYKGAPVRLEGGREEVEDLVRGGGGGGGGLG